MILDTQSSLNPLKKQALLKQLKRMSAETTSRLKRSRRMSALLNRRLERSRKLLSLSKELHTPPTQAELLRLRALVKVG